MAHHRLISIIAVSMSMCLPLRRFVWRISILPILHTRRHVGSSSKLDEIGNLRRDADADEKF